MNDPKPQAQPWHAADEKPADKKPSRAPLGTHSFTGAGANVGMPRPPEAEEEAAERSEPRDMPPGAAQPDPLAEPRAANGDLLGRKP